MKLIFFLLFFICHSVSGQGISAEYNCTLTYPSGIILNYTGKFYYQNNKSISYMLPEYLKDYPNGIIAFNGVSYSVPIDSVQHILFMDLDSGKYVATVFPTVREGKIETSGGQWRISDEIMEVEGYKCKHAYWVNRNGKDTATEIWFTEEIPCPTGFEVRDYVPGFVVKVKTPMNMVATLRKMRIGDAIPAEVFIRKELKKKNK